MKNSLPKPLKIIIGVVLIIVGIVALLTPFTPGAWLALIGLGMLGYHGKNSRARRN